MTGDPLPPDCVELRRLLAAGVVDDRVLDHVTTCAWCSTFAAGLQELDATMAALPRPAPPIGAVDRAVARFRAELASGQLTPGTERHIPVVSPTTVVASPPLPASPALQSPQLPAKMPPSAPAPVPVTSIDDLRRRNWRRPLGLALAGLVAAIVIVAALVFVAGPSQTPSASAETLQQAARSTRAHTTARIDLVGDVGLSVLGVSTNAPIEGHGVTQFPDRGRLSVSTSTAGVPIQQDIISIGEQTWTRIDAGPYREHQNRTGHVSVIDQTLVHPDQALDQLSRVGSQYRSLGTATVTGVKTRRIQFTIPGDSFHAFGEASQRVDRWTVIADIGQRDRVLRRITVDGHGQVDLAGSTGSFSYHLQITLRDFDTPTQIQPPR